MQSYGTCHYCGQTGHFGFDCLVRSQHVREGKIQLGPDRAVYLPDGNKVPWEAGVPIVKAVEDFHRQPAEPQVPAAVMAELESKEMSLNRMAAYIEQMEYAMMYGSESPALPRGNSDEDWRDIALSLQKEREELKRQLVNRQTRSQTGSGFD